MTSFIKNKEKYRQRAVLSSGHSTMTCVIKNKEKYTELFVLSGGEVDQAQQLKRS